MTETPKCPYCGAETRINENNEGIYWYECRHKSNLRKGLGSRR